jgi:hypothetical protein
LEETTKSKRRVPDDVKPGTGAEGIGMSNRWRFIVKTAEMATLLTLAIALLLSLSWHLTLTVQRARWCLF